MDPVGIGTLASRTTLAQLAADVGIARRTLYDARARLDAAVAGLPDVDGDEAMATPDLLVLLVGAVRAKARLDELEARAGAGGDGK